MYDIMQMRESEEIKGNKGKNNNFVIIFEKHLYLKYSWSIYI